MTDATTLTRTEADRLAAEIDVDALRARYRQERDRRIRPDGARQYRATRGSFGYYAKDPYTPRTEREPVTTEVEVLVIGGGFGGLVTAARLREAGVHDIRMMDEAGDFGGTWYWNRYPGIHCDIESCVYMPLLEEVGTVPKWRYAPGEEIRQHAMAIGQTFDLYRDVLFQTRATELRWDEDEAVWFVATDRGDRFRARFVITSSGTLTEPKLPGIPGVDTFRGHTFHTSRWDYGYTGGTADGGLTGLADKRVAVIGTGATGIQVVPHLARDASQLTVFQRTPSTIGVRDNRRTDPAWAASLRPGWQRERQENFIRTISRDRVDEDLTRDGWTETARIQRTTITGTVDESVDPTERERLDELLDFRKMNELRARVDEIVEDPAAAEALKPWYRYMCKRPGFSDLYLQAFNEPNVALVDTADTGGITRMTETGVVVGDTEYEVDCVVFATGFDVGVSGVLSGSLPVYGRDGTTLLETWATHGPRTLHGFTTHGFPNLFQLGPLQNANSVNFVHILQDQAEHVAEVVRVARARAMGVRYVEPTVAAQGAWVATIREVAIDNYRFCAECTPGYYNREGTASSGNTSFGPGPVVFREVLAAWRAERIEEVMVRPGPRVAV